MKISETPRGLHDGDGFCETESTVFMVSTSEWVSGSGDGCLAGLGWFSDFDFLRVRMVPEPSGSARLRWP